MILDEKICDLAFLSGIEVQTSVENKLYILQAMEILPNDFDLNDKNKVFNNSNIIDKIIKNRLDSEYVEVIHQVSVLRKNRVNEIVISLPDGVDTFNWKLKEESQNQYEGAVCVSNLELAKDDKGQDLVRNIDGVNYRKYKFSFPIEVSLGYHNLDFSYKNKDGGKVSQTSRLISAPEKCFDRLGVLEGNKTWGVPVQLYEQVSENNLGIGNFSDLAQLGNTLGKSGAGILGINPLHGMRYEEPEKASPYSPDSRMFLNYMYLDVTAIKEFKDNKDIQDYYKSQDFQNIVNKNKRKTFVDYTTTRNLVDDIVQKCFDKFVSNKKAEDYKKFCVYCDEQGDEFEKYATFRALCKDFSKKNPCPADWQQWPDDYKNPNSEIVKTFQSEHRNEINFFKYAQWLTHTQLNQVQNSCINSGMKIGLYTDMSVGSSCKGFEAWNSQGLYLKASAGAPPDILSQNGQNWNVLGFNPLTLRKQGYEPYRKIMEANMSFAGCTRIDHVLQLQRLYMIPDGKNEREGSFVYYNADELMAVVALESHRNKTMVIGEDLGVLPPGFREKLEDFGIMSYRVLPFEREWGYKSGCGTNAMRHPEEYPVMSTCSTSTHDTPPLASQWNVQDIYQKKMLGILNQDQINDKFEQFATQREALNYALTEKGCWKKVGGNPCASPRQNAMVVPDKYIEATMDYMGQSKSAIMLIPFSDIFGTKEMGNIPGVTEIDMSADQNVLLGVENMKAYPNWRKKMHIPVEHIKDVPIFETVAKIVNEYRHDGNDGKGKYYTFHRLGEEQQSSVDFERFMKLHDRIKDKDIYEFSNIIETRYNDKRAQFYERKTQQARDAHNLNRQKYEELKNKSR